MTRQERYEFGPYEVDVPARLLRRDGEPVSLTPKGFDALVLLLEQRDRVVAKSELMDLLWPNTAVEEANLTQTIFLLRKALGETPDGRQYIETFPRRGYRFVGQVRGGSDPAEAGPPAAARWRWSRRRGVVLAGAVVVVFAFAAGFLSYLSRRQGPAVPGVQTIAVLPFRTISASPTAADEEHLGLGMADALITRLAGLRQIVVRPTGSVVRYSGVEDPLAAGRQLGTDYLLEGRTQRSGGRIRVTVQLLRVADGASVWAETVDEPYTDIFAVQDSIAQRVADALVPNLTGGERNQLARPYTRSTAAYQAYVRGRYHWNRRTEADLRKSIQYFEQAIREDGNYALAYAGLADSYNILGNFSVLRPVDAFPRAKEAASRALGVDASLAEAQVAHTFARFLFDRDWSGAAAGFEKALELNPNYAPGHQWFGVYLAASGRCTDALVEARKAAELDPLSLIINAVVGWTSFLCGQFDGAVQQSRTTLEMDPNFGVAYLYLGEAYEQKRMYPEAIDALERAATSSPRSRPLGALGHAYGVAGRLADARRVLADLTTRSKAEYVQPFYAALIHVGLGERERAIEALERAYQERYPWLVLLNAEPRLDPLRGDARFQDLVRRIGIPEAPAK